MATEKTEQKRALGLGDLKPPRGATSSKKRVGRGLGSGLGKTSGRGHKGQRGRSSGNVRPGFEGGQMPFYRRVPKFGFQNHFRVEYQPVNLEDLAGKAAKDGVVDPASLKAAGLIHSAAKPVKILATGDLKGKLTVKAHRFSAEAKKKIEAAGGKTEQLLLPGEPKAGAVKPERAKTKTKPA